MGKVFCGIGLAAAFGTTFLAGMVTTMLVYGQHPEMGHRHVDALHEAYEKREKKA